MYKCSIDHLNFYFYSMIRWTDHRESVSNITKSMSLQSFNCVQWIHHIRIHLGPKNIFLYSIYSKIFLYGVNFTLVLRFGDYKYILIYIVYIPL